MTQHITGPWLVKWQRSWDVGTTLHTITETPDGLTKQQATRWFWEHVRTPKGTIIIEVIAQAEGGTRP